MLHENLSFVCFFGFPVYLYYYSTVVTIRKVFFYSHTALKMSILNANIFLIFSLLAFCIIRAVFFCAIFIILSFFYFQMLHRIRIVRCLFLKMGALVPLHRRLLFKLLFSLIPHYIIALLSCI